MHRTFVFPINCRSPQVVFDNVHFEETENGVLLISTNSDPDDLNYYDAFDKTDLIPSIIKLGENIEKRKNERNEIKKWVLKWGHLGLGSYGFHGRGESSKDFNEEPVSFTDKFDNYPYEINKFYKLWTLYKAITNRDINTLQHIIKISSADQEDPNNLFESTHKISVFPEEDFGHKNEFSSLHDRKNDHSLINYQFQGLQFIISTIEDQIKICSLGASSLYLDKGKNEDTFKITPAISAGPLIKAIYLQFYILLTENDKKICPTCNHPFLPQRKDKIYCSDTCKSTAKSQRYRAKRAAII